MNNDWLVEVFIWEMKTVRFYESEKKTQCGVSQHNYNRLVGRYSVIESPFDSKMCLLAYTKGKVSVRETRIAIRPLPCISFFLSF